VTWRSEGYYVNKRMPDELGGHTQHSWGAYSYVDYQLTTRMFAGMRFDVALPTVRLQDLHAWDVVPYLTYWQSEFVYLRLQLSYGENLPYLLVDDTLARRERDGRVMLQVNFAAGPHKHEKY
jgi:hypothetical protein